jgi:two-component sensor histidine kinase
VTIELLKTDGLYNLTVADDGIGLPPSVDPANPGQSSLGLQIVANLVKQIDGSIELDRSRGSRFIISFRDQKYADRY